MIRCFVTLFALGLCTACLPVEPSRTGDGQGGAVAGR